MVRSSSAVEGLSAASESLSLGIRSGDLFAGRLGETELAIWRLLGSKARMRSGIKIRVKAKVNAGIWPPTPAQMLAFCCSYEAAFRSTTHVAVWRSLPQEDSFLAWAAPTAARIPLRALDPVLAAACGLHPWSEALEGMRILVVSPFAELARQQTLRRAQLFRSDFNVLPQIDVVPLAPPQSQALQLSRSTWSANLERSMHEIDRLVPHVDAALLSAGAYGMPLARHARDHRLPVIYMGGALQLLFGIEGGRWRDSQELVSIKGSGWVRPAPYLAPMGARLVEKGAYW